MYPAVKLLCATTLLAALGGCSWFGKAGETPEQAAEAPAVPLHFSGYLVNYKDMKPSKTATGGTRLGWVSPELKKGQYTAIMIDPVGFYPKPPLYSKVSKGRMLEATQYLVKQAKQEIGRELKIVDKPGPGVLRWDAAITGVKPADPAAAPQNSEGSNLPVAGIFTDVSPAVTIDPAMIVYLESRLIDTQTQKVVAKSLRAGTGTALADPKMRITMTEMQPVLDNWVKDASVFVREHIK